MTEEEARDWVADQDVSRGTIDRLQKLAAIVEAEAGRQNLIARSTLAELWSRHIVDSLQLLQLQLAKDGSWLDIGSGGGFPGLVIACASEQPITLAEPRVKRAAFLQEAAATLGVAEHVTVYAGRAETLKANPFNIISARAVASLPDLFEIATHLSDPNTHWLLPKGRSAAEELALARQTWQGDMRLVPSLTDPQASIVVARDVHRKAGR